MSIADGIDDDTWEFHRKTGDYSAWLSSAIKDDDLADAVAAVEQDAKLDPRTSRTAIRAAIEQRYTASPREVI